MGCPRVTYRRRMHYNTRSNKQRLVRTPGNRLVFQQRDKRHAGPHCPWVLGHKRLAGTKALNHFDRRAKAGYGSRVSRTYGGVLTHDQVRDRIVRAFLIEEQRVVRKVMQAEAKFKRDKKRRDSKQKKRMTRIKAAAKKVGATVGKKKTAAPKKAVAKKTTTAAATKAPVGGKVVAAAAAPKKATAKK
jgi:large subunit ribosomal protein L34e